MKKYEAGFIGAGNMGGALALAAMKKVGEDKVAVACSSEESTAAKAAKLGCAAAHAEDAAACRAGAQAIVDLHARYRAEA